MQCQEISEDFSIYLSVAKQFWMPIPQFGVVDDNAIVHHDHAALYDRLIVGVHRLNAVRDQARVSQDGEGFTRTNSICQRLGKCIIVKRAKKR